MATLLTPETHEPAHLCKHLKQTKLCVFVIFFFPQFITEVLLEHQQQYTRYYFTAVSWIQSLSKSFYRSLCKHTTLNHQIKAEQAQIITFSGGHGSPDPLYL